MPGSPQSMVVCDSLLVIQINIVMLLKEKVGEIKRDVRTPVFGRQGGISGIGSAAGDEDIQRV